MALCSFRLPKDTSPKIESRDTIKGETPVDFSDAALAAMNQTKTAATAFAKDADALKQNGQQSLPIHHPLTRISVFSRIASNLRSMSSCPHPERERQDHVGRVRAASP